MRGKTRDKVKRGIYRAGKALTRPGAFLHKKAEAAMYSGAIETFLYAVMVMLLSIGTLLMVFSPRSPIPPVIAILLSMMLFVAAKLLIGFLVPAALYVICAVTAPFVYLHERWARKLSGGGSGDGQTYRPGPVKGPRTELERAEELFGVTAPYTRGQLRDARNKLLKRHHPDLGGSEELAKRINAAYELLVKYAS